LTVWSKGEWWCALSSLAACVVVSAADAAPWRFAVVGDTHVPSSDTVSEMLPQMRADSIQALFVIGDLVEGGVRATSTQLKTQLARWKSTMRSMTDSGVEVYAVRGNHEADVVGNLEAWNAVFSGADALPANGPSGEENLTYSVDRHNARFVLLDQYVSLHRSNLQWLDQQLATASAPHVFVMGHEAAFRVFHTDMLGYDSTPELSTVGARDVFWKRLESSRTRVYFAGHDHFLDLSRIDNGDGRTEDDVLQCVVGTGGGWRMSKYAYNGNNSTWTPRALVHEMEHGYMLVEVEGTGDSDLGVTLTWKHRVLDAVSGAVTYEGFGSPVAYRASPLVSGVQQAGMSSNREVRRDGEGLRWNIPSGGGVERYRLVRPDGKWREVRSDEIRVLADGSRFLEVRNLGAGLCLFQIVSADGRMETFAFVAMER